MKRELDDSDAASAVTLPQSRTRPDDASGYNKAQPLINRPPTTTRSQQLLETNFDTGIPEVPRHAVTTGYLAHSNENFFLPHRSNSTPLETDM
ncbi:Lysyl oxidase protein 4 [Daphnia magna]|uniref:Lysyl oxidase protein 4 n=2 Tax=Daphnia magna TaxID=35525 RepID=A0A162PWN2_9CRUS|nr:Lysyl oxidase protein 4 [Daphnia magna]